MNNTKLSALVLILLFLVGCSSNSYRYVNNGGDSYILLNGSYSEPLTENESGSSLAPFVTFSSIEEMKKDIQQGTFTEEELKNIFQFSKDSNGNIIAPNIDRTELSLPEGFELDFIRWFGGGQPGFHFVRKNNSYIGSIECWTQESLHKDLKHYYHNKDWAKNVTTEEVSGVNGKLSGTVYYFTSQSGEKWKDIQYEINANGITYYVQEQYELALSDEDPNLIIIWCFGSDTAFMVTLVGDNLVRPTVDEITSFHLAG